MENLVSSSILNNLRSLLQIQQDLMLKKKCKRGVCLQKEKQVVVQIDHSMVILVDASILNNWRSSL